MTKLSRTVQQWWATARRLEQPPGPERPDLSDLIRHRIHSVFPSHPHAHPDTPVTVSFSDQDCAVVEARAPLTAWWMPVSTASGWALDLPLARSGQGDAVEAVAAAEAIIRAHQRRPPHP